MTLNLMYLHVPFSLLAIDIKKSIAVVVVINFRLVFKVILNATH